MSAVKEADIREPLILGDKTYHQITEDVCGPIENPAPKGWYILLGISAIIAMYGVGCILYLISEGIGTWGLNNSVDWAWDITNFVWWVGIGHAGTLISAVLLLFRQKWRMAVNRSAEAMTIFAVMMAAIFPGIHMGRIWMAYWVLPLPNQFGSLWVNFNSPLLWDVFAISTYFSVSLVFWYIGLIPDFATIRDRMTKPLPKKIYGIMSFGWSGRAKHWNRFEIVSLVLAGIATPLVFSVHSIVSFDFATSVIPGWHTTIFPPYFVAGAVFSGFAMVQTLMLIVRKVMKLEAYIHTKHIEYMNIVIMVTGSLVGIAYITELFMAWYSGVEYESYAFINRATGPMAWAYWVMMTCNVISPQLMWWKKLRTNLMFTFIMSIVVNIGMWFERFVIIVTSLYRGHIPATWTHFFPTWVDVGVFIGTMGIFSVLYLLYARFFPVLAISEVKTILKSSGENYKNDFGAGSGYYSAHHDDHEVGVVEENVDVKAIENTKLTVATVKTATDNLTKIEGIGPKIAKLLSAAGISSFADLAISSIDKLKGVLEEAGSKFTMHDPSTWPEQAKLAADGKWDELKKWQDELDGGKVVGKAKELTTEEYTSRQNKLIEKLGKADASNADDLKKISGVGPVLEKTLNSIGIFTFEQVSKMTKEDYDLLDSLTKAFPGRAERDDWAGQAKELMNNK